MATMFPADPAAFTTTGEERVFRFLRQAARPDSVFMAWYSPDIEDREPDFILLSPECGLIVLEVKDWLAAQIVEADPKSALLQIGTKRERRKQPLAQAREYVNSLLRLLGKNARSQVDNKPQIPCPITWGAVFPHITREEFRKSGLDQVMDEDKVLFWDDLDDSSPFLRDKSGQQLRSWLLSHFPPRFAFRLTPADTTWLRACIFPVVRIDIPRRGPVSPQDQVILAMDHDQENLARNFGTGKMLISGPAGSGKTLILVHQAWHLPRVDRNVRNILFVCFNLSLVGYIRRLLAKKGLSLGPGGVEVIPFYKLCAHILGENLAHSGEDSGYYELVVQETLARLEDKNQPCPRHWDAILVDEGQDFTPDMARVILALLPKNGTLAVAEDENQNIYGTTGNVWKSLGIKTYGLSRQYRNSRPIAALAAKLLAERPPQLAGANGADPAWLHAADAQGQIAAIADSVAALVREDIPMSEIAILYTRQGEINGKSFAENMQEALERRGVLSRWVAKGEDSKINFDITTESVCISTIHSVKGLDFAHVFLVGLDKMDPESDRDRRLAHVAMTRARESLTMCILAETGIAAFLRA